MAEKVNHDIGDKMYITKPPEKEENNNSTQDSIDYLEGKVHAFYQYYINC